jgi:hypothetical protein
MAVAVAVVALSIMAAAILVVVLAGVVGKQDRVRGVRAVRLAAAPLEAVKTEPPATTILAVPVAVVAGIFPSVFTIRQD